jgi:hypothetical protein
MKLISHRGNINGPDLEKENTIEQIFIAIGKGFDVEVDVWVIDGLIFFGHDYPKYLIDDFIIKKIKNSAWFHCKNLEALLFFAISHEPYVFFWHQKDDFTLTSNGYIWTYPNKDINSKSIIVDLDLNYKYNNIVPYGICTDYPFLVK